PVTMMSKRKVSSTQGRRKGSTRENLMRLLAKPAFAKVEMKPKKVTGKDKSSNKNVETKGKGGAKGKQAVLAKQEKKEAFLKIIYLSAENRETKNEESPASDEAEEKEAKSD
ncbi:HMGN1 protein, partial [Crocuta crocuta]